MNTQTDLRYPIGPQVMPKAYEAALVANHIADIAAFPERLRAKVEDLPAEQRAWIYRPEGWSIRQVVHHCADSHINAFIRFKLALTEDNPTIRPYNEADWALLPDASLDDWEDTLALLTGLHSRWVKVMRAMGEADWQRSLTHPEYGKVYRLWGMAYNYAWHSNHHLAHVQQALDHQGKF